MDFALLALASRARMPHAHGKRRTQNTRKANPQEGDDDGTTTATAAIAACGMIFIVAAYNFADK